MKVSEMTYFGGGVMDGYGELEDKILDVIFGVCETCPKRECCVELECPLFVIEKLITNDYEE